jgi:hypothetical protein
MPASPESAAEYIEWAKANTLSPGEAVSPVEKLRDHLIASRNRKVEKAACEFAAGRLDADALLAIATLSQAIDGMDKSIG